MSDTVRTTQVVVIGGGPGGYPAAFGAADHGFKVTIVDADPRLGGVCLNRGCIPSKALLHVAKLIAEAKEAAHMGLTFGEPKVDLAKLREFTRTGVIGRMTGGLDMLTKAFKVERLTARATFVDSNTLRLEGQDAGLLKFEKAILAVGSLPAVPKSFQIGDPRVMDSTGALALQDVPAKLLVVGGGYIGLEMGTVYASLGSKVTVVEALDTLLAAADQDLVAPLAKRLRTLFDKILLNTSVAGLTATPAGIVAKLAPKEGVPVEETFDRVLVAIGRRPNSANLGLENTKVVVTDRGFVQTDKQCRTADANILAIGDVAGEPMLAHKATAEAKVAVETLAGEKSEFSPRAIPAVVFTDPEIAWAGITEAEAKKKGVAHEVLKFPWAVSGRATTLARNEGLTKMIVAPDSKRILGVGIVGVGAGELIAESTLAIEMGAVARDVADTIHAHPTLAETVMESAELALGFSPHVAKKR